MPDAPGGKAGTGPAVGSDLRKEVDSGAVRPRQCDNQLDVPGWIQIDPLNPCVAQVMRFPCIAQSSDFFLAFLILRFIARQPARQSPVAKGVECFLFMGRDNCAQSAKLIPDDPKGSARLAREGETTGFPADGNPVVLKFNGTAREAMERSTVYGGQV